MSRLIKNDHPYTEDEIRYLKGRRRIREIELNAKRFPDGVVAEPGKTEKVELSEKVVEYVKGLDSDELKEQLEKHEISVEENSTVKELKLALAQKIQAEQDATE